MDRIRIGTRGSKLALQQAALVRDALLRTGSVAGAEIVVLHTKGDRIQEKPLHEIGGKGVFASELEHALSEGRIDIAVHSAKDLPIVLADGLFVAAVLPRADVRDVLVIPAGGRVPVFAEEEILDAPWEGAKPSGKVDRAAATAHVSDKEFVIGTGSRRRRELAGQLWKNIVCEDIRGNVDTRLRKLGEGGSGGTAYDGIILAKAGMDRLGIGLQGEEGYTFCPLPPEQFLPAACQGIIAAEALRDSEAAMLCKKITDAETELCFLVERETLAQLAADCNESVAAWCRRRQEGLILDVMYAGNRVRLVSTAEVNEGLAMARRAAELVREEEQESL